MVRPSKSAILTNVKHCIREHLNPLIINPTGFEPVGLEQMKIRKKLFGNNYLSCYNFFP